MLCVGQDCCVPDCRAHHQPLDFLLRAGTALCCWCTVLWTVVSLVSCSMAMSSDVHQPVPRNPLSGATLCALAGTAFVSDSHMLRRPAILFSSGVSVCTPCLQPLLSLLPTRVRVMVCVPGLAGTEAASWALLLPRHTLEGLAMCGQGTPSQCHQPAYGSPWPPRTLGTLSFGVPSPRHTACVCACRGSGCAGRSLRRLAAPRALCVRVLPFPIPCVSPCLAPAHGQGPARLPAGSRASGGRGRGGGREPAEPRGANRRPTPLSNSGGRRRGRSLARRGPAPSPPGAAPLRAACESGLCRARAAAAAGAGSQPPPRGAPWRRRQR